MNRKDATWPRLRPGVLVSARAAAAVVCAACLGAAAAGAGGCASEPPRTAGRTGVTATYLFRTLHTELEPEVSVLTCSAAAEQALRARGYAIERASTTEESSLVIARPPRGSQFDRAVVESRATRTGTSISVRIEPFGDQGASYAIMDALLTRIGY